MKLKIPISILALLAIIPCFAQQLSDEVLFTVDDDPVLVGEFLRVYNKNLDLVKDDSKKI